MIAFSAKCPVVPAIIEGAYEIWPRGQKIPKFRGRITVTFGPPIYPDQYLEKYKDKKEAQQALLGDLTKAMQEIQSSSKK